VALCAEKFAAGVDHLYEIGCIKNENPGPEWVQAPVTGMYCRRGDKFAAEVLEDLGRRALIAQEAFRDEGPADLQPLPISFTEICDLPKDGGRKEVLWYFASTVFMRRFDYEGLPHFHTFARGLLAKVPHLRENPELVQEFPPKHLPG